MTVEFHMPPPIVTRVVVREGVELDVPRDLPASKIRHLLDALEAVERPGRHLADLILLEEALLDILRVATPGLEALPCSALDCLPLSRGIESVFSRGLREDAEIYGRAAQMYFAAKTDVRRSEINEG